MGGVSLFLAFASFCKTAVTRRTQCTGVRMTVWHLMRECDTCAKCQPPLLSILQGFMDCEEVRNASLDFGQEILCRCIIGHWQAPSHTVPSLASWLMAPPPTCIVDPTRSYLLAPNVTGFIYYEKLVNSWCCEEGGASRSGENQIMANILKL